MICAFFTLSACSQLTLKQGEINHALYTGNAQQAYDILNKDTKRWEKNRNALLYYWNKGTVAWMLGKHQESSELFMTADYFLEDVYKNYANIAASLFLNDKVLQYVGEDHERVLFHYYQMLNFMQLGNMEYALVQARRLQLELERLDDRYKDKKALGGKRYQQDAFAYVLLGLVYEAAGETNNAFIAYKRAVGIYSEDYSKTLGTPMPEQLKLDLLRTAYEMGFHADLDYYEKQFGITFDPKKHKAGNLVFFWNNGLSPEKEEVSLNFVIMNGPGVGWVTFVNQNYGYSFPVYVGDNHTQKGSSFSQVEFVRAAFPKYFVRGAYFEKAELTYQGQNIPLEKVEDVSAISQKVLNDRFMEEIGKTLLRLALKKASEYELRKTQPEAGAALGIVNYFTEQADTRSWESLPHQISYARTALPSGKQQVQLNVTGQGQVQSIPFDIQVPAKGMIFQGFHSLQPAQVAR